MRPEAAVAAHRFGLGEPSLAAVDADPPAWLRRQIGPADPQQGHALPTTAQALQAHAEFQRQQRERRRAAADRGPEPAGRSDEQRFGEHFRRLVQGDVRARLATAATTQRPFAERLALFWSNHFTVSMLKPGVRGLVGSYEREAIRPHVAGRFEALLGAAVRHPAMLRYLDNDRSAGPGSRVARFMQRRRDPRVTGLNENLAREVLELHTLGVAGGGQAYGGWGGYTQADVTEFARVLTGWRVDPRELDRGATPGGFDARWHEPGTKTVLGRRHGEGPQALDAVLAQLAHHPSTARFLAYKLARHFVADQPPPALVATLAERYQDSGGELAAVYAALLDSPLAWLPPPTKLKTPEEFVVSTVRLLGLGAQAFERAPDAGIGTLGQAVHAAPSPAGWADAAEEWLGPDAVWKRIEWAARVADRTGRRLDARALADSALGPRLGEASAQQIRRAADAPQALALLLLAPEFQRR